MFEPTLSTLPYIRSGKLRALAVTSATRSPALPDVPVLADFVPGYEATSWFGIGAPRNTPPEIIDKLNDAITTGLADPEIKQRLGELGGVPMPMTPAQFGKLIADETDKWGKVHSRFTHRAGMISADSDMRTRQAGRFRTRDLARANQTALHPEVVL